MLPNSPPPGYAAPLAAEDHPDLLRGDPDYMLTLAGPASSAPSARAAIPRRLPS